MQIFLTVVSVFVGGYLLLGILAALQRPRERERREAIQLRIAEYRQDVTEFEARADEDWPVRHVREDVWLAREYLMMSADQHRVRHAHIKRRGAELIHAFDRTVSVTDIVSAELMRNSETIMTIDTTAITKKSGALARAAVGGALFGGAGAVVGAASAGSRTSAQSTATSTTRTGPTYLLLGTTDLHDPMLKVQMNSAADGEIWLRRIQGAIAVHS